MCRAGAAKAATVDSKNEALFREISLIHNVKTYLFVVFVLVYGCYSFGICLQYVSLLLVVVFVIAFCHFLLSVFFQWFGFCFCSMCCLCFVLYFVCSFYLLICCLLFLFFSARDFRVLQPASAHTGLQTAVLPYRCPAHHNAS